MRGLGNTDDRTFVGAFQAIDRGHHHPLFMAAFFGTLVFSALAAVLYLRDGGGSVRPWVIAACALYVVVLVITFTVNLPLNDDINDDIKAVGDPDRIDNLAAVRDAFHESRWVAWNVVRAVATTVAFVCLTWALVLHGRTDTDAHGEATARPAALADR
jgi:uncharacterized membrane protein